MIAALDKWKVVFGPHGISLQLQDGDPPQTPVDIDAYNAEVAKYKADPNPDPANYPEIAKYQGMQKISCFAENYLDLPMRQQMGHTSFTALPALLLFMVKLARFSFRKA